MDVHGHLRMVGKSLFQAFHMVRVHFNIVPILMDEVVLLVELPDHPPPEGPSRGQHLEQEEEPDEPSLLQALSLFQALSLLQAWSGHGSLLHAPQLVCGPT